MLTDIFSLVRVLIDVLDDTCDIGERAVALPKKFEEQMKPFEDITIDDPHNIKHILEELPPERAAALMTALIDLASLLPGDNIDTAAEFTKIENALKRFKNIRANLRLAMEGYDR